MQANRMGLVLWCAGCAVAPVLPALDAEKSARTLELAPDTWTKVHEQKAGDAVRFLRQAHGGSCFDAKRGCVVLFGSNTHGKDWTNSPLLFDTLACAWTRLYPDDPRATYAVAEDGLPVCGEKGLHPWAMHTFGAVVYDASRDEMLVCCFDEHLAPGRFTEVMKELWPRIKRKPTWSFDLEKKEWRALPGSGVSCFPHCAAYDADRKLILAYKPDGIYELGGEGREWKRVADKGFFGWHTNCAYDAKQKALVVFGSNENSNDVAVYVPATKEHKKMPTPGERPPPDQHNPMEFHPGIGKTVVLVDRVEGDPQAKASRRTTETWLYDLGQDAWTQLKTASLPFACGMNYNLEYDPGRNVLWLVTGGNEGPTTVWALRVDLAQKGKE